MDQGTASTGTYATTVNHRVVNFNDPAPEGRQILHAAGFDPADDHVLIQLIRHGTRSIRLDERVDLREPGREAFEAFRSDRIYVFTINEHSYEWGAPSITEPELRAVAAVPEDEALAVKRPDGKDEVLGADAKLDLAKPGTEHLVTKKRLVRVFYDGEPREIPAGVYTTEQLIAIFSVPAGYLLNVVDEHGQLVTLKPGQHVRVHQDQKFFSQVPSGSSS